MMIVSISNNRNVSYDALNIILYNLTLTLTHSLHFHFLSVSNPSSFSFFFIIALWQRQKKINKNLMFFLELVVAHIYAARQAFIIIIQKKHFCLLNKTTLKLHKYKFCINILLKTTMQIKITTTSTNLRVVEKGKGGCQT